MLYPRKHFDTSGKSAAPLHHRAICKTAHGTAHRNCGALDPFGFGDSALVNGLPVRTASASRLSALHRNSNTGEKEFQCKRLLFAPHSNGIGRPSARRWTLPSSLRLSRRFEPMLCRTQRASTAKHSPSRYGCARNSKAHSRLYQTPNAGILA